MPAAPISVVSFLGPRGAIGYRSLRRRENYRLLLSMTRTGPAASWARRTRPAAMAVLVGGCSSSLASNAPIPARPPPEVHRRSGLLVHHTQAGDTERVVGQRGRGCVRE